MALQQDLELMAYILAKSNVASSSSSSSSWIPGQVLPEVTKLNVPNANLTRLPKIFCKILPNLSILFCPNNKFEELPPEIGQCPHLQMVSFKCNGMKRIHPEALQPQLRWLILTDNAITSIPPTIGRCTKLQKCMLSGNALTSLPMEMNQCTNLELIRLASNQLTHAPMHVLTLPNLAWVGLSANPFVQGDEGTALLQQQQQQLGEEHRAANALPILTDPELDHDSNDDETATKSEILGRGASGITRKVYWKRQERHVAVKTYASGSTTVMTSDGSPVQERTINQWVASHPATQSSPYLIQVLGQTPPPKESLVMELLKDVATLGDTPSMESCSRDVYPIGRQLASPAHVRQIVVGLWTVLRDLHSKLHICHGDFYGHNILVTASSLEQQQPPPPPPPSSVTTTGEGETIDNSSSFLVKLSDFGAAFFCHPDSDYGQQLERIEMRAFGHLVDEVRMLHYRADATSSLGPALAALAKACHDDVDTHGRFAELEPMIREL